MYDLIDFPVFHLDNFFSDFPFKHSDVNIPKIDILEDDNDYQIIADIPGVEKKDIDISIEKNILTLSAERKNENEQKDKTKHYYKFERNYGLFKRKIEFDNDIEEDKIIASYHKGVLKIIVPKKENKKKKIIEIK